MATSSCFWALVTLARRASAVSKATSGGLNPPPGNPADAITWDTPAVAQAFIKMRRRYGPLREEAFGSSFFCRVLAFTSGADCDGRMEVIRAGYPISGIIESAAGKHLADRLTGWGTVSTAAWKLRSPSTFPEGDVGQNCDSLAVPPGLAKVNFAHPRAPNIPYARLAVPKEPKYIAQFSGPAVLPASRVRGSSDPLELRRGVGCGVGYTPKRDLGVRKSSFRLHGISGRAHQRDRRRMELFPNMRIVSFVFGGW